MYPNSAQLPFLPPHTSEVVPSLPSRHQATSGLFCIPQEAKHGSSSPVNTPFPDSPLGVSADCGQKFPRKHTAVPLLKGQPIFLPSFLPQHCLGTVVTGGPQERLPRY